MAKKAAPMTAQTSKAGTLNKKSTAGFTLFELIIVMAIMGLILGVAIPNISLSSPERDMDTAIRRLSGAVSEARSRALLKRTPLELHLEPTQIVLFQKIDNKKQQIGKSSLPDGVTITRVLVDDEEQRTLQFKPKGITQPANISLSAGSYRKTVFIKPVQGISY